MRTHQGGLWVRLRELMAERDLVPAETTLVYLFPDGPSCETGVLLSDSGRVYDFELTYDLEQAGADRWAHISSWRDITDRWQTAAFRREIRDAFIWRPPLCVTMLATTEAATTQPPD
ncbi:hypothetical protein [Streptomyces sp. NPDC091027]|uniref:hypothetical protein n=1 Tax=Streptomyces sp. NPDC091027 TaxID=3365971 RepID=UPI00380F53D2